MTSRTEIVFTNAVRSGAEVGNIDDAARLALYRSVFEIGLVEKQAP